MDSEDHVRPRLVQVLVAAVQVRAAEIGGAQASLLQHGPHGAVEDQNAFFEGARERPLAFLVVCHERPAVHCSVDRRNRLSYARIGGEYTGIGMALAVIVLSLWTASQYSYQPFAMYRVFPNAGGAVFVGTDTQRLVAVEYKADQEPAFRVLGEAEAQPWIARVRTSVGTEGTEARRVIHIEDDKAPPSVAIPPLPRTTYDQFAAARPRRVQDGYTREQTTEIQDSVGPWQDEGGRTWFGKTFYDGEGSNGVGGFGYLDWNDGKLHVFTVPEIADWSVSAIAVAPDAVWMALVANGEWGPSSGGLLRYDRQTVAVRRFEFPDVAVQLIRAGGKNPGSDGFRARSGRGRSGEALFHRPHRRRTAASRGRDAVALRSSGRE